jgi:hypothetical protein
MVGSPLQGLGIIENPIPGPSLAVLAVLPGLIQAGLAALNTRADVRGTRVAGRWCGAGFWKLKGGVLARYGAI